MGLEGKTALVTGASRGIGRQIALTLAAKGALVIVNYNGSKERAEQVAGEIKDAGGQAVVYGCSVADYSQTETMIKDIIKEHGSLDILVNNAGITKDNLLMKMTEQEFEDVISTNLKGTFNCIKHVSRQMLRQKSGRIINISSVVGIAGNAGQANYAASKAGIIGLTKSAAKELGSRGITVNAVAPGFVETEMTEVLSAELKEKMMESIALKRAGRPEDIANAVVFLASGEASYITGQVLCLDGGMAL